MLSVRSTRVYVSDDLMRGQANWLMNETGSMNSSKGRPRILVVDDEKIIADTVNDILVSAGFEVVAVYDAWSAIETAASFHPEYLLSDVSMPGMNGVQLGIAIRKAHPATKILLFSGQTGISEILSDGERQGYAFELISKPIHPLKLIEIIRRA